jgi:hypothetical protein
LSFNAPTKATLPSASRTNAETQARTDGSRQFLSPNRPITAPSRSVASQRAIEDMRKEVTSKQLPDAL